MEERSRVEELAEEVMQKELQAQRKELEDLERAGYSFEGTRLAVVADEVFVSFLRSSTLEHNHLINPQSKFDVDGLGSRDDGRVCIKILFHPVSLSLRKSHKLRTPTSFISLIQSV